MVSIEMDRGMPECVEPNGDPNRLSLGGQCRIGSRFSTAGPTKVANRHPTPPRQPGVAMSRRVNRREFVLTGTAGLAAAAGVPALGASGAGKAPVPPHGQAPAMKTSRTVQPVVISSANGNQYKNGGAVTCVQKAFTMMTQGSDVLD